MSHIRRCRPEIIQLLERHARYGLTYRELSEESGISISTFAYWAAKRQSNSFGVNSHSVSMLR